MLLYGRPTVTLSNYASLAISFLGVVMGADWPVQQETKNLILSSKCLSDYF